MYTVISEHVVTQSQRSKSLKKSIARKLDEHVGINVKGRGKLSRAIEPKAIDAQKKIIHVSFRLTTIEPT